MEAPNGTIQLLLTDHADLTNGYATPFPYNRITVFARPPLDAGSISYFDDWLELVITHELVHTFHLDMSGTPLGRAVRTVLGRLPVSWPAFPSGAAPRWMTEGLATYFESELTGAGRVNGTWQDMVLRTAVLSGTFATLDQLSGASPVWPGGHRPYVYGARYLAHMANIHGEEAMGEFARSVAGLWVPFRMNAAARDAFGTSVADSWDQWRQELADRYTTLADSLAGFAPITEGEVVEASGRVAQQALVSPAGHAVAFVRSDGIDKTQIRLANPNGSDPRFLTRVNGTGGTLSWGPGGQLYFQQLDYSDRYRLTSDLYRAGTSGTVERLTDGQRITYADVSPDGTRVVAVQEGRGTSALVTVELASGEITPLSAPDPEQHWAFPRWSPDGRHIAAVRWVAPAMMDIVVLDTGGSVVAQLTNDRAVDTTPFWTPDGSTVIWSSDRTGIPNLFAAAAGNENAGPAGVVEVRQVTNMLGGALHPSVDPGGRWIYFSSYHSNGWHIERIPFRPEDWFAPQPHSTRFADAAPAARLATVTLDPEPYRSLVTLRPRYWAPLFRPSVSGLDSAGKRHQIIRPSLGWWTTGEDLVGRHAYSLSARLSFDGSFAGNFGYRYRGLGNPVLGVNVSQSHDASSRALPVRFSDGSTREFFLLERERRVRLSTSFLRQRYRSRASLSVSGSLIVEDLKLQDLDRSPGPELTRPRPHRTFGELSASLFASNTQRRAFSVSREDGVSLFVSGRWRRESGLDADQRGQLRDDRGFKDLVGEAAAFKALRVSGYANHVLGLRLSAGIGYGPGADQGHFKVGGAEGAVESVTGLGLFGGSSLLFPVRGYHSDLRAGRIAWSGSFEYRFPVALVDRGLGSFPLFFDRISGSVFVDAGNAWGPVLGEPGYDNPRLAPLVSAGAEVSAVLVPGFLADMTLRLGVGAPLRYGSGPLLHVRVGSAF